MDIRNFIKQNSLFLIITILFVIWMAYLLDTTLPATRTIHFYEIFNSGYWVDASNVYTSQIPFERYFIEPFVGLTFIFTFENDPTDILLPFIMVYVVVRVALLALDNTILRSSGKKEVLFRYIKDLLEFYTKYASLMILLMAAILGIGYLTVGFLFLSDYFEVSLHLFAIVGVLLLFFKAIYNITIFLHPKKSLKVSIARSKKVVGKVFIRIRRELFYIWTAFLLLFTLNFAALSIPFPTQYINAVDLAPNEVLCDFHGHTMISDGMLTPEERVLWYIDQGIQIAAFSDHSTVLGAHRAQAFVEANHLNLTVLLSQEFTDDPENIHLNIFGIDEEIIPKGYSDAAYPYGGIRMNVSEMIPYVKAHGGYVIVNHYDSNASAPFSYNQLKTWGVDGFEVHMGVQYLEIRDFCVNNGLIWLSSTDMHLTHELNEFTRLTLTDPTNRTLAHIFDCLHNNNHSGVVIPDFNYPKKDKLEFFNAYLSNLDGFQALSWILWSGIAYGIVVLLIWRTKKAKSEKFTNKLTEA